MAKLKLVSVCNDCGCILDKKNSGEAEGGVTNGLCGKCSKKSMVPVIRRSQVREGVPDCFDRCFGNCHKYWCAFHPYCVTDDPNETAMHELFYRLTIRRVIVFGYPMPPESQQQYFFPTDLNLTSLKKGG